MSSLIDRPVDSALRKRDQILDAAMPVFGRCGFKKSSVNDLAAAAGLSKQGLYLHFASKEEVFLAAMRKYLDDGLALAEAALSRPDTPLFDRLLAAMDAWFGRHIATFLPSSRDVIEAGDQLSSEAVEGYKAALLGLLARALAGSCEWCASANVCTPEEIARVLFQFGLTWKEGPPSRAEFLAQVGLCVRACCQIAGG